MNVLFVGCVQSSKIILERLLEEDIVNIVGVITKENSRVNSDFYDLANICREKKIDYKYVNNINDKTSVEYIIDKNPDIIYCFGWSQIIKEEILQIPNGGVIGFHPAELPMNRGRHPIIWALALGLERTASTFFKMDIGADSGDIVSKKIINIDYKDNAEILYNKIMDVAKEQVIEFTKEIIEGKKVYIPQDELKANYWRKRGKSDGQIDWRMDSKTIYNLVRALYKPYPGAHFVHNDRDIKVWEVEEINNNESKNIEAGKVIEVYSDNSFLVKVSNGLIKVIQCDDIKLTEGDYL